ncbi:prepilin-type cleavage/methylation domain-containing protein [Escherichia coli]|nr:prepilin-type cleavage/methylation domain-containing protein [Escherichia coli]EHP1850730.1 prepilin-type cleavage/methylation domain-containing protein [Escherichia coli]EKD7852334.1 prepilin-type cleavage/methylation domain-containing protein [Escherichia coli]HAI2392903.1 prepilin-type cleavage/methylation domain-containing protein [Escherichia coli]HAL0875434.1 prepilin-type cleavage/methylation domain-containing protein [Escherichia coli]
MNFRARIFYYFSLKKEKEEDKGLTLLEIAGALIIIGIVVTLAMSQMSSTMASSDNQRELKNLQTIATKMKQYKFQGRYTGTDYIKTLTESGSLPADMIAGGNKAKNAWGGDVTIATTSNKYGYIITSKAVPKENCVELINSLRSSSMFTKIKGQTPASVDPVTVCSAATNDITLETSS